MLSPLHRSKKSFPAFGMNLPDLIDFLIKFQLKEFKTLLSEIFLSFL
jgi:hypothetical protein